VRFTALEALPVAQRVVDRAESLRGVEAKGDDMPKELTTKMVMNMRIIKGLLKGFDPEDARPGNDISIVMLKNQMRPMGAVERLRELGAEADAGVLEEAAAIEGAARGDRVAGPLGLCGEGALFNAHRGDGRAIPLVAAPLDPLRVAHEVEREVLETLLGQRLVRRA